MSIERYIHGLIQRNSHFDQEKMIKNKSPSHTLSFPDTPQLTDADLYVARQEFFVDVRLEVYPLIDCDNNVTASVNMDGHELKSITLDQENHQETKNMLSHSVRSIDLMIHGFSPKKPVDLDLLDLNTTLYTKVFDRVPQNKVMQIEKSVNTSDWIVKTPNLSEERTNMFPIYTCGGYVPSWCDPKNITQLFFTIHNENRELTTIRTKTLTWWRENGLDLGHSSKFGDFHYYFADYIESLPTTLAEDILSGQLVIKSSCHEKDYQSYAYDLLNANLRLIRIYFK